MEPAVLLHIAVPLLVTSDRVPEIVLTEDKQDADKNKEVVHLMMELEELVVVADAVTLEDFPELGSTEHVHCQPVTAPVRSS